MPTATELLPGATESDDAWQGAGAVLVVLVAVVEDGPAEVTGTCVVGGKVDTDVDDVTLGAAW